MNPPHHSIARRVFLPRLFPHRVTLALARSILLATVVLPIGGCSSVNLRKAESAAKIVYEEATSTAGRKLLADVTSAALNVGLDFASGNTPGAAIAGIQGAASAMRDYEGLPTAPGSATIARAAAAGSGVTNVAIALVPTVETLVSNARQAATQQKVNITTDDIIEAVAKGFDAVADAHSTPPAR